MKYLNAEEIEMVDGAGFMGSVGEGAASLATIGAIAGAPEGGIGAVPGAAIGAVIGGIVGGICYLW